MSDPDRLEPFADAVANIRETAKWMIASLGGVFTVMLGGFQLKTAGFSDPSRVGLLQWIALAVVFFVVGLALWLAIDVLVSEGTTWDDLVAAPRFESIRKYINAHWSHTKPPEDVLGGLAARNSEFTRQLRAGVITADDPTYVTSVDRVLQALSTAGWRLTLSRLKRLRVAFLALLPAAVAATLIIASRAPAETAGSSRGLSSPVPVLIATSGPNAKVLGSTQWPPACLGPPVQVLIYQETVTGIGEAATFPTAQCHSVRLLLMDRQTILKVL